MIDDAQLIGFLLGSLEPHEVDGVRAAIDGDPSLQARLEELRAIVSPLEELNEAFDPPANLIASTWDKIDASQRALASSVAKRQEVGRPTLISRFRFLTGDYSGAASEHPGQAWMNRLATAVAVLAMASLLLPAIENGRYQARRDQCASNLASLGVGLTSFASFDPRHHIPEIPSNGRLAFSGYFAIQLKESGRLESPAFLICPSVADQPYIDSHLVPTTQELLDACEERLSDLQKVTGGTMAYNLGVLQGPRYSAPTWSGRTYFAIMSDAPTQSGGLAHRGRGYNVLYEDGHVVFLRMTDNTELPDDPFTNRSGKCEAGLDPDDSVVGASHLPPYAWCNQR